MSRHTPTYEECYALVLLRECLHMTNLELSDRPDIVYDNKSGIEVVSALFEGDKRLENIIQRRQEGKKSDPIPEGYAETPYLFTHPKMVSQDWMKTGPYDRSLSDAVILIKDAIAKKKQKVSHYTYATNSLFIFADLCLDDDALKSIGEDVYQYANDIFNTLYILVRDANCLMVCDSNNISLNYFEEKQHQYACQAQQIYKGGLLYE